MLLIDLVSEEGDVDLEVGLTLALDASVAKAAMDLNFTFVFDHAVLRGAEHRR